MTPAEAESYLYAGRLWTRAKEYRDAFAALNVTEDPSLIFPAYHLICHSTELGLKAFLAAHGTAVAQLEYLGQDARRMLRAAKRAGLRGSPGVEHLVRWSKALNGRRHALRYPGDVPANVPHPDECLAAIDDLLNEIKTLVQRRSLRAHLRQKAGETIKPGGYSLDFWRPSDRGAREKSVRSQLTHANERNTHVRREGILKGLVQKASGARCRLVS